jgi:hypothetical protein
MGTILVGTDDGLHQVGGGQQASWLRGRAVGALARGRDALWAVTDGRELWREPRDGGGPVATAPQQRLNCVEAGDDEPVAGTAEAHLMRLDGGELRWVDPFDRAEGRDRWYTPWGGPPDVRSLARDADGTLWVNVHVGGILRAEDGGERFTPTIDVDSDVHQVAIDPTGPGRVLAATAYGLAGSDDAGASWRFSTEGMHASYCRAVAVAGDQVVVTCSTGPRGGQSGLYRRPLAAGPDTPFERCQDGLPEWFDRNIDTACLDADGEQVAFGTAGGELYGSADAGATWDRVATGLPPVRCLLLAG